MIHIALEGIDNSGKTTISAFLETKLVEMGIKAAVSKELTTDVGKIIISLFDRKIPLSPKAKTLMFAADRLLRYEQLKKNDVDIVIWDRYVYSAIVYRQMEGLDTQWVQEVNSIFPDAERQYYLDIDPIEAQRRGEKCKKSCPYTIEQLTMCRNIYKDYVNKGDLVELETKSKEELAEIVLKDIERLDVRS